MTRPRIFVGLAALLAGCATTQSVRIACVPREVQIYVDGRLIEGNEAALRTDRAHKIYAKGPGYEPRLVVLEPEVGEDGRAAFRDEDLCVQVVPIGMNRELEVDVERDAPGPAR
ncbi:MAG: hypothetical protein E6J87_19770 [Deltaproteobacteria bacterium]|nr:MAG: hypothetical protein E6J87_19770 [Deltaproteobacteria bacterium]